MPAAELALPLRRQDLRVEPFGERGDHVVKDPRSGDFYLLGQREHFLLQKLDGRSDAAAVRSAYQQRFDEPLSGEELDEFLATAGDQGMLDLAAPAAAGRKRERRSILYWRRPLLDPDRLFARIEPRLRWIWTPAFAFAAIAAIAGAIAVLLANPDDVVQSVRASLRLESVVAAWLLVGLLGLLHESAHGLTCRHFGGAVREIGLLFLYFTPCFYCNVSDAWLFREKSKRCWVMLAGGACDLVIWALAVFVWRIAEPGTFLHRNAFLVVGIAGLDSLSNFNPLLKLDGYYLLSDWQELPNLRQRALERAGAHARRILWGAPPPEADERGRFLTTFGLLTWLFSAAFLVLTVVVGARWLHGFAGAAGDVAVAALVLPAAAGSLRGVSAGEVTQMLRSRRGRAWLWLLVIAGVAAAGLLCRVDEFAGGSFTVRPAVHAEVRAPIAGFLAAILTDEGRQVAAGDVVARLEVPDLDCRLEQRRAELREAQAELELLQRGTRPEEIAEQRDRVERAARWRDLATEELARMKRSLAEELEALDQRCTEAQVLCEAAESHFARLEKLSKDEIVSREELESAEQGLRVARARVNIAKADLRARASSGTTAAEVELARREKELGDERSRFTLLQAGARPEEIAAQTARRERLGVEIGHLEEQRARLEIRSSVAGVVVTRRLRERAGEYVREGDSICVVEENSGREAEVALDEEDVRGIERGQTVHFKVRALPYQTIEGRVLNVATRAAREEGRSQGTVVVCCSMERAPEVVRTSMGGYARIYTGPRPIGALLLDKAVRLFRTEFWW
jgi:putative peptide zinc metalloprotease protein